MSDSQADTPRPPTDERPTLHSEDLFRGTREIVIVHKREQYRLRVTRGDKLILTK